MNRFGYKAQQNQTQSINTQAQIPCFFPPSFLNQQPSPSLLNNINALNQQINGVPTNQFSYDSPNHSDDEDLDELEISLILQQNLLLNCLISQIESDIGQISSNLQKQETPQLPVVSTQSTNNVNRRRTANGIRKLSEKNTGSKGSSLSSLLKKAIPKKLTKRKLILSKRLGLSRKIAEKLLKRSFPQWKASE